MQRILENVVFILNKHMPIQKLYYCRRGKHICKEIVLYFLLAVLIFAFRKYVFYSPGANFIYGIKKSNLTLLSYQIIIYQSILYFSSPNDL